MEKDCFNCKECYCFLRNMDAIPRHCPTRTQGEMVEKAKEEFDQEDVRRVTRVITLMTKERYSGDPRWTRIEEIVRFCQLSEFKRIGIAACIGFHNEAKELTKILRSAGLEVTLVLCQIGAFSEEETGVWMPCISGGIVPSVCNPVMQAWVLNSRKTELNIAMGLCLGDDYLFQKYSAAPVTTLAVKDRATGNDTLAPIYAFHLRRFLKDKFGG